MDRRHGREFDVMICFPKLVCTGLDLFSKVQGGHNYNCIVFYETGYKLNEMRQAARRAWRIGQPRDCYIYYMYYQGTMQHRAMSLMSKKMAAALALEGEFSEEGLAAMAGEGDEQMALAKSMSEKIDDADMQRSWSKVKSLTDKKKPPKKRSIPTLADLAADAKPDALDTLEAEAQLLARTILERQRKPVPASSMPDIIWLAERFAQADEGMWGAARSMAFREEPAPVEVERPRSRSGWRQLPRPSHWSERSRSTDGNGNVLVEATNKISVARRQRHDHGHPDRVGRWRRAGHAGAEAQGSRARAGEEGSRCLRRHRVRRCLDRQDDGEHRRERDEPRRLSSLTGWMMPQDRGRKHGRQPVAACLRATFGLGSANPVVRLLGLRVLGHAVGSVHQDRTTASGKLDPTYWLAPGHAEDTVMRSGLCVLAVMLMAPPIGQDSKQKSKAPERNELSSLETLWNEAHRTGDADKLDGLSAEDLRRYRPQDAGHDQTPGDRHLA